MLALDLQLCAQGCLHPCLGESPEGKEQPTCWKLVTIVASLLLASALVKSTALELGQLYTHAAWDFNCLDTPCNSHDRVTFSMCLLAPRKVPLLCPVP